jgi:hypothetical protein
MGVERISASLYSKNEKLKIFTKQKVERDPASG